MPSIPSQFVYFVARLFRLWRKFKHPESLHRHVAELENTREARPTRELRAVYRVEETERCGRPIYTVSPKDPAAAKLRVVYFHGGAYTAAILTQHWQFLHRLMGALPCAATVPLYGLAPKFTCQDAFPFLLSVYKDLLDECGAENIVLMGDSAGGGLALALAQFLRDDGLPQPRGIVLLSPWLDATMTNPGIPAVEPLDFQLSAPALRDAGRLWAGELGPADPLTSPINGSLAGLAPLCLFMGTRDILLPDARRFRRLAQEQGARLAYYEYADLFHAWMILALPESREVMRPIVEFVEGAEQ